MKFEWDSKKNKINIQKHGISFEEACFVFNDPNILSIADEEHSLDEE
ncbi:MAG: BrnT family toxin [Candidatus Caenarcaniphilales bacterium]|nr:BrnT family toxin [Candidatus Caenarcaniphilales bacterium]